MGEPYKAVTVAAAKKIAEAFDKDMVIILAWDARHALMHTTTYGREAPDKEAAAMLGEHLAKACDLDLSQKQVHADFHDEQPDHPVQIDECGEVAVTLGVALPPDHPQSHQVVDEAMQALGKLDFVGDTYLAQGWSYTITVRARSVAEMHRLLPAFKAKIREVLTGMPVTENGNGD